MFHKVTKHPLGSTSFLVLYPEPKKRTQRSFSLNFYFILEDRASLVAGTVKNLPATGGDPGLIPGLGGSPGEGNSNPLQYSCLGSPTDRGTWQATVHRVTNSRT